MSAEMERRIAEEPLSLGAPVPPFGDIRAVSFIGGERFYMIVDDEDVVTLLDHATARQMHLDNYDGGQP